MHIHTHMHTPVKWNNSELVKFLEVEEGWIVSFGVGGVGGSLTKTFILDVLWQFFTFVTGFLTCNDMYDV